MQAMLEVWAGRRTATEAAQLRISRKTYYAWEARALSGMRQALERGEPGRPAQMRDREKEALVAENRQLREALEIQRQREEIRTLLAAATTSAQKKYSRDGHASHDPDAS